MRVPKEQQSTVLTSRGCWRSPLTPSSVNRIGLLKKLFTTAALKSPPTLKPPPTPRPPLKVPLPLVPKLPFTLKFPLTAPDPAESEVKDPAPPETVPLALTLPVTV